MVDNRQTDHKYKYDQKKQYIEKKQIDEAAEIMKVMEKAPEAIVPIQPVKEEELFKEVKKEIIENKVAETKEEETEEIGE